jgi:hypothetical protein
LKGCHPSSTFRRTRPVICRAPLIPLAGLGPPWIVWGTREARVRLARETQGIALNKGFPRTVEVGRVQRREIGLRENGL